MVENNYAGQVFKYMTRLPIPGQDNGSWGQVLNEFLSSVHNTDGSLKDNVVSGANIIDGTIDATNLNNTLQDKINAVSAGETNLSTTTTSTTVTVVNDTGDDAVLPGATAGDAGVMTASDKVKLNGIIDNAQVTTVAGRTGAITLTPTDVGLDQIDNTSDTDKPVSSIQQAAFNAKANADVTITAGTGLTGGGDLSSDRTLSIVNDASTQKVEVSKDGSLTGSRKRINFIEGNNISVTTTENVAGNRIDVTLAAADSVGEANTVSNVGTGEASIFKQKSGVNFELRTLTAGSGATLTQIGDTVRIDATGAGGGEVNTMSNVGTAGVGIFKQKNGTDFEVKKLNAASSKLTVVDDTTNSKIDINVNEANFVNIPQSAVTSLTSALSGKQASDSDLTTIAGLVPVNNDVIQRKAGAWTNRTPAQLKTDLAITKADVSLSNVDNTSDLNKPLSTAAQTAINAKANADLMITAGAGLTGGGTLNGDLTIAADDDSMVQKVELAKAGSLIGTRKQLNLIEGSNITLTTADDVVNNRVNVTVAAAGSVGETNTASNVGAGVGNVFKQKTGVDLEFRTLISGSGATVSQVGDTIRIDATGTGGGESNTASNIGTAGIGIFKQKSGIDLQFKKINVGSSKVTLTDDVANNEVKVNVNEANFTGIPQSAVTSLTSALTGKQTSDADLTSIANLTPVDNDIIQRKAGAWTNRTVAQFKTDLTLTKTDVGLSNVDNTTDINKPISTATQTALNAKAATATAINTSGSLIGGGNLTATRTLSLSGDSATPGNSKYYGTDGTGVKGYFDMTQLNALALRSADAVVYYNGSAYPLRNTVTTDTLRRARWVGPVAPTAGAGYATSGLDVWEKTS